LASVWMECNFAKRLRQRGVVRMTTTVNVHEAKTHFSKLLSRVATGEEIVIAKAGKPVARLVPLAGELPKRVPGSARGKIWVADDFDAPLPDDVLNMFEGREEE